MNLRNEPCVIPPTLAGKTLAACVRALLEGQSWSQVRRLIETGQVLVNRDPSRDESRRLASGDIVELAGERAAAPASPTVPREAIVRYVDSHLLVVEKPAGVTTMRRPEHQRWSKRKKQLFPALDEALIRWLMRGMPTGPVRLGEDSSGSQTKRRRERMSATVAFQKRRKPKRPPMLWSVHRLDRETSGLLVFARTLEARDGLIRQFRAHSVLRRYLAVVQGHPEDGRIETYLLKDRGDGLRGSRVEASEQAGEPSTEAAPGAVAKRAVTHVAMCQEFADSSLIECRLETGRTNQIRIHLAERGHPVCGETKYLLRRDGTTMRDGSRAPRLALHAAELGFVHPILHEEMTFEMALPRDLQRFAERLAGHVR